MKPRFAIAAVVAAAVLIGGCTNDDDANKEDDAAAKTTTTTAAKVETVVQTKDAPRTEGFVGARTDVTDLTCVKDGGSWKVAGKVKNPTGAPVDYRIFTSFLDDTKDTAGLLQTDVAAVAAGATQPWSGELPVQGDDLECVLRVERTDAAKR